MLVLFAVFSELVYLFLIAKSRQFGALDLHNDLQLQLVIASLALLFLGYLFTYLFTDWEKVDIRILLFVIFLGHLTFLAIPFISSSDLYSYIFSGRLLPHFGANPYLTTYDTFQGDNLYNNIRTIWSSHTTLYGPLFLLLGGLVNIIGGNNLGLIILIFKSLLIGANLISTLLIYSLSKSEKATFLYGLNPLVVFELAGNSHNESVLILFLLVSLFFISRPVIGFGSLTASFLVKYSTLILVPFYLIYIKSKGLKVVAASICFGLALAVITYIPFWGGLDIFNYLISYYNGEYISPSLGIFLGQTLLGSYRLSFQINTIVFLLTAGILVVRFWFSERSFKKVVFYSFLIYWAYVATKLSLVLTWYLIPLVALGSLCVSWREYRRFGEAGVLFTGIYSLFLYYFVR